MSAATSRSADVDRQVPALTAAVGPGWSALLSRLHQQLVALAPDYQLDSFTTQFGGLRINVADRCDDQGEFDGAFADAAAAAIGAAEDVAGRTCESCGATGRPRFHGDHYGTWIKTLCDQCHSG